MMVYHILLGHMSPKRIEDNKQVEALYTSTPNLSTLAHTYNPIFSFYITLSVEVAHFPRA